MTLFRIRLGVGQPDRCAGRTIEGASVALWPVENGSEALIEPLSGDPMRVPIPAAPAAPASARSGPDPEA
jgi:hypothetical protein